MNSGHTMTEPISYLSSREFDGKFRLLCQRSIICVIGKLNESQRFTCSNLIFTFPVNCIESDISLEIEFVNSPKFDTFQLPECLCLFRTNYADESKTIFNEMANIEYRNEGNVYFFNQQLGNHLLFVIIHFIVVLFKFVNKIQVNIHVLLIMEHQLK
ncbi:unnamed protein product [Adineta ricciae]|uniref:Uncharacterized protein n=1 Tax=Adineta ricciae TaxID=249248 RepID=A0A815P3M0_ADIRI|nr:unnamed protein product [Adineta ricciae]CAF1443698.1 unnamed protein product [Adineta ricciae]